LLLDGEVYEGARLVGVVPKNKHEDGFLTAQIRVLKRKLIGGGKMPTGLVALHLDNPAFARAFVEGLSEWDGKNATNTFEAQMEQYSTFEADDAAWDEFARILAQYVITRTTDRPPNLEPFGRDSQAFTTWFAAQQQRWGDTNMSLTADDAWSLCVVSKFVVAAGVQVTPGTG
jgi:hypothetical protein